MQRGPSTTTAEDCTLPTRLGSWDFQKPSPKRIMKLSVEQKLTEPGTLCSRQPPITHTARLSPQMAGALCPLGTKGERVCTEAMKVRISGTLAHGIKGASTGTVERLPGHCGGFGSGASLWTTAPPWQPERGPTAAVGKEEHPPLRHPQGPGMCSQNGGPTARAPPPRDRPRHSLWAHEAGADRHCDRGCVCTHACVCTFFYFNTRVFYAEIHRDFTGVISFAEMTPVQQTWEKRQKKFH